MHQVASRGKVQVISEERTRRVEERAGTRWLGEGEPLLGYSTGVVYQVWATDCSMLHPCYPAGRRWEGTRDDHRALRT
jgi:hypothetical protein